MPSMPEQSLAGRSRLPGISSLVDPKSHELLPHKVLIGMLLSSDKRESSDTSTKLVNESQPDFQAQSSSSKIDPQSDTVQPLSQNPQPQVQNTQPHVPSIEPLPKPTLLAASSISNISTSTSGSIQSSTNSNIDTTVNPIPTLQLPLQIPRPAPKLSRSDGLISTAPGTTTHPPFPRTSPGASTIPVPRTSPRMASQILSNNATNGSPAVAPFGIPARSANNGAPGAIASSGPAYAAYGYAEYGAPVVYQAHPASAGYYHPYMPMHQPHSTHEQEQHHENKRGRRFRRRYNQIIRKYNCLYPGCLKSYGLLNHLNTHIVTKKHGHRKSKGDFKHNQFNNEDHLDYTAQHYEPTLSNYWYGYQPRFQGTVAQGQQVALHPPHQFPSSTYPTASTVPVVQGPPPQPYVHGTPRLPVYPYYHPGQGYMTRDPNPEKKEPEKHYEQ